VAKRQKQPWICKPQGSTSCLASFSPWIQFKNLWTRVTLTSPPPQPPSPPPATA